MKTTLFCVLILFSSGCVGDIIWGEATPHAVDGAEVEGPAGHAEAATMAWSLWGEDGDHPAVHWFDQPCLKVVINNAGDRCVAGTFADGEVWLSVRRTPSQSALAHEFLHAIIGDPSHSSPRWNDELNAINAALAEAGY